MRKLAILTAGVSLISASALAQNFSFTGNFTQDDNVQLFNFVVGAPSNVTLETLSYAGGTNAAGATIARGGFDPILALFDSAGNYIDQNDDGGCGSVPMDISGECYDTYLNVPLNPGTYTVAVMEYDNFANGPTLADGFERGGQGNFTPQIAECDTSQTAFLDVSGSSACARDSHWAFDILNVASAIQVIPGVPEPASWAMMLLGFAGIGVTLRKKRATVARGERCA